MMMVRKLFLILALFFVSSCSFNERDEKIEPMPEPPKFYEHVISQPGETLGEIATWYTGDRGNLKLIAQSSGIEDPNRVFLGQVVLIPMELVTNEEPLKIIKRESVIKKVKQVKSMSQNQEAVKKILSDNETNKVEQVEKEKIIVSDDVDNFFKDMKDRDDQAKDIVNDKPETVKTQEAIIENKTVASVEIVENAQAAVNDKVDQEADKADDAAQEMILNQEAIDNNSIDEGEELLAEKIRQAKEASAVLENNKKNNQKDEVDSGFDTELERKKLIEDLLK